jgi:hypothetical protein
LEKLLIDDHIHDLAFLAIQRKIQNARLYQMVKTVDDVVVLFFVIHAKEISLIDNHTRDI